MSGWRFWVETVTASCISSSPRVSGSIRIEGLAATMHLGRSPAPAVLRAATSPRRVPGLLRSAQLPGTRGIASVSKIRSHPQSHQDTECPTPPHQTRSASTRKRPAAARDPVHPRIRRQPQLGASDAYLSRRHRCITYSAAATSHRRSQPIRRLTATTPDQRRDRDPRSFEDRQGAFRRPLAGRLHRPDDGGSIILTACLSTRRRGRRLRLRAWPDRRVPRNLPQDRG